jgi:hypothetical protein
MGVEGRHLLTQEAASITPSAADGRIEFADRLMLADLAYISGCVNEGSSPSLWPKRR